VQTMRGEDMPAIGKIVEGHANDGRGQLRRENIEMYEDKRRIQ
jgi:hypothetical protein